VPPADDIEMMLMLRALETSDRRQQIMWRQQTRESLFTDLPGYVSAGNDVISLPLDLFTSATVDLDKRWADHNSSKSSSTNILREILFSLLSGLSS